MNQAVVDIFDPVTGEPVKYKRVSARIQAFNEQYSFDNGYRIESEMIDSLSLQPGRLALLREAIASGKGPAEVGLHDVESGLVMVCVHRLIGKDDKIVRDASAAKRIVLNKDYEVLETASLQRLMAKLGHGGEIFDDDEDRDIDDQSLPAPESASVAPIQAEPVSSTGAVIGEPAPSSKTTDTDTEGRNTDTDTGNQATATTNDVPPAMYRQIGNLAKRLGESPPLVATFTEAKAALKDLNKRIRSK
ncbi:MAG: hypothetical protein ACR2PS_11325 [Pseudomonadales bacterium]